jgi:ATP-binding cassette subfamily B protein
MAERRKYNARESHKNTGGPGQGPRGRGGFQKPKNVKKTAARLLTYITRRRLPIIAVVLCLIFSAGSQIAGTYMLRPILNDLVGSGTVSEKLSALGISVLILGIVYLLGSALTYCQAAIMVQLAQRGTNRLRKDLFNRLQDLPLSYFDSHTHGELMSRFSNDADNVQMALEQSLTAMLSSALTFIGVVAAMIYTCPPLFLVTILTLAATLIVFKKMGGKSREYYRKQQAALGEVNGNIQEIIEGLKVVKAFGHEEQAKAEFAVLNTAYREAAKKANFYSTAIMPTTANIMNVGYALTAVVGGMLSILTGSILADLLHTFSIHAKSACR